MPDIGLSRPYVAKYNYVNGKVQYTGGLRYGRAASMDIELDSPDSNDDYLDNAIGESADSLFAGGTLTTTTGEMETATSVLVLGIETSTETVDGQQITVRNYTDGSKAPYVGYGTIVKQMVEGVERWMPLLLPKVKFNQPSKSVETQGETITWQHTEATARIFRSDETRPDGTHPWMKDAFVETEEMADKVIRTWLGMPITQIEALDVISVADSTAGYTDLTVTPAKGTGNHYMVLFGENPAMPYYDKTCGVDEGYTPWDGSAPLEVTGTTVLVVETDENNNAKKAGMAVAVFEPVA